MIGMTSKRGRNEGRGGAEVGWFPQKTNPLPHLLDAVGDALAHVRLHLVHPVHHLRLDRGDSFLHTLKDRKLLTNQTIRKYHTTKNSQDMLSVKAQRSSSPVPFQHQIQTTQVHRVAPSVASKVRCNQFGEQNSPCINLQQQEIFLAPESGSFWQKLGTYHLIDDKLN